MNGKTVRVAALTSVASLIGLVPATMSFAATAPSSQSPATIMVQQGPEYTDSEAPPNAVKPSPSSGISPMTTSIYSANYNTTQTFTGFTDQDMEGSYSEIDTYINVADAHKSYPWQPDYLSAHGKEVGTWYGSNPYNASNIYLQLSENVTSTSTVVAVSIPAGASFSTSSNTAYLKWQEVTNPNTWDATYTWGTWQVNSSGTIKNAKAQDEATFQFGSRRVFIKSEWCAGWTV